MAFLHWRYDEAAIRSLLPAGLEPDIIDGSAWVSLTPFQVERFRVTGLPPAPLVSSFPETNVRTYVRLPSGRDGLFFFSLDVASTANAVTGRLAGVPYFRSRMCISGSSTIRYRCRRLAGLRAGHDIGIRPGPALEGDELAELLTGRWRSYSSMGRRLLEVCVEHEPWPLRTAELENLDQSLLEAARLPRPEGEPLVHFSDGVDARLGSVAALAD